MGNLLVIDSKAMRNTWRELLQVRPFHSLVSDDAFQVKRCPFTPGIVLIDLDAFGNTGQCFAVVEELRSQYPDTPVIVLMTDPLTMAPRAYDAGASACLPKPLDYAVILKLLDLMVRSNQKKDEVSKPVVAKPRTPALATLFSS